MKFCQRINYIKPKTLKYCYRIMGNIAYFQEKHDYGYYCIFDLAELRKMQFDRIKENMKSGQVDDWECCDSEGKFSFFTMAKLKYNRASAYEKETILKLKEMTEKDEDDLEKWEDDYLHDINNFEAIKVAQFLNEDPNAKYEDIIPDEEFWRVINNANKVIAEIKNKCSAL